MTFAQISQAVYRRVKLADTPSPVDITRIQQFINLWYRELLALPGMDRLRDTTLTFASVIGQKKYGLPQALTRVRDIYDLTNQRRVMPKTMDWLRNVDPGLSAVSATAENWIPLNGWGAQVQELTSTGMPLYVRSSLGADVTQKVFIETMQGAGQNWARGLAVAAGTTLNGTTATQVGTLSTHVELIKVYLDTVATGFVSVADSAAMTNSISVISPGRTSARYFMIQLYPTPSAVVSYSVDCQRAIEDLTLPTEEPLLPEDFHHCLVHFGCYEEWMNRGDDRYDDEYKRGMKIVADMRHALLTNPDEIAVQRGPRGNPERISRLGGWFPAGT